MNKKQHFRMIEITEYAYDRLSFIARKLHVLGIDGQPSVEHLLEDIAAGDFEIIYQDNKYYENK